MEEAAAWESESETQAESLQRLQAEESQSASLLTTHCMLYRVYIACRRVDRPAATCDGVQPLQESWLGACR